MQKTKTSCLSSRSVPYPFPTDWGGPIWKYIGKLGNIIQRGMNDWCNIMIKHSPPTSRMTTKHQMFVFTTTWKTSITSYIYIHYQCPPVISSIVQVIYWDEVVQMIPIPFHDSWSSHLQSRWSKVIFFRLSPKMWIALIIVKWQGVLFAETKKVDFKTTQVHKMTFL